jgi:hypothetical protein
MMRRPSSAREGLGFALLYPGLARQAGSWPTLAETQTRPLKWIKGPPARDFRLTVLRLNRSLGVHDKIKPSRRSSPRPGLVEDWAVGEDRPSDQYNGQARPHLP